MNDELCRMLGYRREELLRKSWAEITHPDDLAADVAQFERVLAGGIDGYSLDKRWIRKDASVIDSIMAAQAELRAHDVCLSLALTAGLPPVLGDPTPSIRPSPAGWEWDLPSAARSSRRTAAGFGGTTTKARARRSN